MADYKVVFRDESPAWQQGCPLRIEVLQVARSTKSQRAFLQMKARNVSGETVGAVEVVAHVTAADGSDETVELGSLDADIRPGAEWTPTARELSLPEVTGVSALVTRAGDMTSFESAIQLPEQEALTLSPEAARARDIELETSGIKPEALTLRLVNDDAWWLCSCGTLNVGRDTCRECGASKELLAQLEDQAWLEERDRELRYQAASDAFASGKIGQVEWAAKEFEELGDYRDSPKQVEECRAALERAQKKSRKAMVAVMALVAVAATLAIVSTQVIIPRFRYSEALAMAEEGRYEEALERLSSLGDYGDAEQLSDEYTYEWAMSLYESGDFERAYNAFLDTTNDNAPEMLNECARMQGAKEVEEGDAKSAIAWYWRAGDNETVERLRMWDAFLDCYTTNPVVFGNAVSYLIEHGQQYEVLNHSAACNLFPGTYYLRWGDGSAIYRFENGRLTPLNASQAGGYEVTDGILDMDRFSRCSIRKVADGYYLLFTSDNSLQAIMIACKEDGTPSMPFE